MNAMLQPPGPRRSQAWGAAQVRKPNSLAGGPAPGAVPSGQRLITNRKTGRVPLGHSHLLRPWHQNWVSTKEEGAESASVSPLCFIERLLVFAILCRS